MQSSKAKRAPKRVHDEDISCSCAHGDHAHDQSEAHDDKDSGTRVLWIRVALAAALMVAGALLPESIDWLRWTLHSAAWLIAGYDIALRMLRGLTRGQFFNENVLMTVATIGAFIIGETLEGVAVMVLYQVGEALQARAVYRSRRSIAKLCDIRPDRALVLTDGRETDTPAEQVPVGAHILVRAGEKIPLDGRVLEGESALNTAALTGESAPRAVGPGSEVLAGTINQSGRLLIEVTARSTDSVAARTLRLVEEAAGKKARMERFITRFARIYTPIVMLLAVLVAVIPPLVLPGAAWQDWFYNALVFLVTSCPCALVISIPLCSFAGIGGAARRGILVKGGGALEMLADVDLVAFDKTGTLTTGRFAVESAVPAEHVGMDTLLRCAAIAEMHATHPLAATLRDYCGDVGYPPEQVQELPGLGVSARFAGQMLHAGSYEYLTRMGIKVPRVPGTTVHVALDGQTVGYFVFRDELRPESAEALRGLHGLNIATAMLSGDRQEAAALTAAKLGIDHVEAELLPEDKLSALEGLMTKTGGRTAFVGDGINDAAVLARADVGVAMGGIGSDAAIEAADVVLMADNPAALPVGIRIARKSGRIARQNVVFALGFKAVVLVLAALGIATLWLAIVADIGVALLAVANALRVSRTAA